MSPHDEREYGGGPDVDELLRTDELLDRLARRAPDARDLDDPVVAALAVLAGDVDLAPVSVLTTRRALTSVPSWLPSLPQPWQPDVAAAATVPDGLRLAPGPESAARTDIPDEPLPWAVGPHPARRMRSRSRRAAERGPRTVDHPRVLPLRPRGVAAAAVLVLLGGGISLAVSNDPGSPLSGFSEIVGRLTDGRTAAQRLANTELTAQLDRAEVFARNGDVQAARKIIAGVQARIHQLSSTDQAAIQQQINIVQVTLQTSAVTIPSTLGPTQTPTSTTSAGGSDGPTAAVVTSGSGMRHPTANRSRTASASASASGAAPSTSVSGRPWQSGRPGHTTTSPTSTTVSPTTGTTPSTSTTDTGSSAPSTTADATSAAPTDQGAQPTSAAAAATDAGSVTAPTGPAAST